MRLVGDIPPIEANIEEGDWYEPRGYPHFDYPVGKSKAQDFVRAFPSHPYRPGEGYRFWPFIKRYDKTPRYRSQEDDSRGVELKIRPICYASHVDSHIYKAWAEKLNASYEKFLYGKDFAPCILAYRSFKKVGGPLSIPSYNIHLPRFNGESKSNIHFARDAFCAVKNLAPCVALALDVKGFFDNMDHRILKNAWMDVEGRSLTEAEYKIYKAVTEFSYVEERWLKELFPDHYEQPFEERDPEEPICDPDEFHKKIPPSSHLETNRQGHGIPQGSPISALLSNVYMAPFDEAVHERIVKDMGGIYLRYSDDILLVVPPMYQQSAERFVMNQIKERKLEIQPKKTERRVFSYKGNSGKLQCWNPSGRQDKLQYLGFTFDGQQILIRDSSITRYDRRANASVRRAGIAARQTPVQNEDGMLIRRKRLYDNHTHLGDQNFITYAYRADEVMKNCPALREHSAIREQVSDHMENMRAKIKSEEKKVRRDLRDSAA
jgi:hypothetical protein